MHIIHTEVWFAVCSTFGVIMIQFGALKIKFHNPTMLSTRTAHSAYIHIKIQMSCLNVEKQHKRIILKLQFIPNATDDV